MKSFLKTVFATFFALGLFYLCLGVVFVALLVGLAQLGNKQESPIKNSSYLVFNMSVDLTDTPPPSDTQRVVERFTGGDGTERVSVRQALESIAAAKEDSRIAGIFLHGGFEPQGYGSGFAAIKEVREALLDFKASKKPVVAYLVAPSTRDYYLASVADTVYLNPIAEMEVTGLASQPMFFADAFQKYGIGIQVTRVGKYKSFVEPFTRDSMSPENREQTQKLLDDLWGQFKQGVAEARPGITAEQIQQVADTTGVLSAQDAVDKHLADKLAYLPDVIGELRQKAGSERNNDLSTFRQVSIAAYAKDRNKDSDKQKAEAALSGQQDNAPKVAIIYAEGDIVDGDSDNRGVVAGDRFARVLRKLRQDASVKAVLLRVNSPGGSAVASEVIQRETVLLRAAGKPVIVSMGTVAASGGYWITTASEHIFAEPNTITGSIGVFGILPNIQKLANDHGITFDEVKTGKFAGATTIARPKTPEELQIIQGFVDRIYDQFIKKVADSRKLSVEQVQEIAQGRVWSGLQAKEINLIDEIGGLQAALAYTKKKVNLPADAKVVEYPEQKEFAEQLAEAFKEDKKPLAMGAAVANALSASTTPAAPRNADLLTQGLSQLQTDLQSLRRLNDPRGVYARLPMDLQVR